MATHSSTLAWRIPWMEEPDRLQSIGSLGVGHNWATSLSLFTFMHWRRKWQPTPIFLSGDSQGWGACWAAISGFRQSQTWLKWLSSSSIHYGASLVAQLVKNPPVCGRPGFSPWVGKILWRSERLPTPVFWPGEFHGLYSPWGCKALDMTEWLSLHFTSIDYEK